MVHLGILTVSDILQLRSFVAWSEQLDKEVGEEGSSAQTYAQHRDQETGSCARLLPPHHLGAGHHADGGEVAAADTEHQHDHDVGHVTLQHHRGQVPLSGVHIAEEKQWEEGKSK